MFAPSAPFRTVLALLLAVACLGYLINLGGASIWDANEAFYVETPREMIERGDYINPTFNYEPRVNKPVLPYWIVAGLYQLFGISVTVQRAAIAVSALVMIAGAFALARAASLSPLAAWLAAAGLAANPRFFMFARRILIDVGLAAFMTLTLTFFALAERYPQRRRAYLIGMYVATGLGVLMKGPVAAVLPALAFLAYLAVHGELRRITSMMLPLGAAIVLLIVAPWYVALYLQHGWDPIVGFFVGENLERYTSLIGPQGRPFWFYLPVIVTDHLPWSLCLPGIAVLWWRDRRAAATPDSRVRTLLVLWVVVIAGFFSLSRTKQDLYIFPIAAAIAALGGDFVARALRNGAAQARWTRWLDAGLSIAAVALLIVGGGVLYLFARATSIYGVPGATLAGVLLIAGGGGVAVSLLVGRPAAAVAVLLASSVAFCWTLALQVLPGFERYKPVVPLSDRLRQHARPGDVVAHFDVALPSMVFYTGRRIEMLYDRGAFLAVMRSGRTVHAVLPASRHKELGDALAGTCVLARQPTADVKLRAILAGEPPPAVLLISTRCDPGHGISGGTGGGTGGGTDVLRPSGLLPIPPSLVYTMGLRRPG